jgi:hypothetical protein
MDETRLIDLCPAPCSHDDLPPENPETNGLMDFHSFHQLTPRRRLFYSDPTWDSNGVDSPVYRNIYLVDLRPNETDKTYFSLTTSYQLKLNSCVKLN